jgi:hypothetical protein
MGNSVYCVNSKCSSAVRSLKFAKANTNTHLGKGATLTDELDWEFELLVRKVSTPLLNSECAGFNSCVVCICIGFCISKEFVVMWEDTKGSVMASLASAKNDQTTSEQR